MLQMLSAPCPSELEEKIKAGELLDREQSTLVLTGRTAWWQERMHKPGQGELGHHGVLREAEAGCSPQREAEHWAAGAAGAGGEGSQLLMASCLLEALRPSPPSLVCLALALPSPLHSIGLHPLQAGSVVHIQRQPICLTTSSMLRDPVLGPTSCSSFPQEAGGYSCDFLTQCFLPTRPLMALGLLPDRGCCK